MISEMIEAARLADSARFDRSHRLGNPSLGELISRSIEIEVRKHGFVVNGCSVADGYRVGQQIIVLWVEFEHSPMALTESVRRVDHSLRAAEEEWKR